jgi:hypothetical protein
MYDICVYTNVDQDEKMIKNQARFQVGFQIEYLSILPKVITCLKNIHQFSLERELVISNHVFFLKTLYHIKVVKSIKVKVSNFA